MAISLIFCGPNSTLIPNKYVEFGYKGLIICRNGKHGQGTNAAVFTKMIVDTLTEITSNALRFICPSPEVLNFDEKRLHWASLTLYRNFFKKAFYLFL